MQRTKIQGKNKGKLGVVIVAAGTSQRMAGINKLFTTLGGKPLLAWSVDTCQRCGLVQQIVLVLNGKDLTRGQKLKTERGWSKVTLCPGGARRQDSVWTGLKATAPELELVLIHDAARPFPDADAMRRGCLLAQQVGGAVLG
jgi:2-C-methyl-D-erythritol 4-phosphate cytidylyltransferase